MGPWVADALVIFGLLIVTIGVYGVVRMPDIYTKLHAASKSVFLGINAFVAASLFTGDAATVWRVLLIGAVLTLTTPVASHVIGRASVQDHLLMETPGAIDESGHHLADAAPGADERPHD
ncbi:MAG: monovalent cation/H(+) antiporter subunit G [Chloroflexia bacterium]|nr:monovalent cation/H(+) antiporter subunit G [Chloroflexia bacterium]